MPPESVAPPAMGPSPDHEATEAEMDAAMAAKAKAQEALEAGDHAGAVTHLTTALAAMPSALMYARRAEALLKERRPVAAVRDCDAALQLNPDSAKVRFRPHLPAPLFTC